MSIYNNDYLDRNPDQKQDCFLQNVVSKLVHFLVKLLNV